MAANREQILTSKFLDCLLSLFASLFCAKNSLFRSRRELTASL